MKKKSSPIKKKVILLVGQSASGKDYLCNVFGLEKVISHTTRKPRAGEIDGVHKYFHDKNEVPFRDLIAYTVFDGNEYWATIEDLHLFETGTIVYIIDPAGVIFLAHSIELWQYLSLEEIFSVVVIQCSWYKRLYRLIKRDGFKKGINRFIHDCFSFRLISKFKDHGIEYKTVRV